MYSKSTYKVDTIKIVADIISMNTKSVDVKNFTNY